MKTRAILWFALLGLAVLMSTIVFLSPLRAGQDVPLQAASSPRTMGQSALPVAHMRAVKRLCVEDFEGGENARQLRAMLIDHLRRIDAFVITENPQNADAFLRGFAEDLVYTEQHSRDESVTGRSAGSLSSGGPGSPDRRAVSLNSGVSDSVRERSTERRHEASLSVRIVNLEGDVLWSAIAESRGGKYRSAAVDASAKIAGELRKAIATKRGAAVVESTGKPSAVKDSLDSRAAAGPVQD